jgi:hypothetical protein
MRLLGTMMMKLLALFYYGGVGMLLTTDAFPVVPSQYAITQRTTSTSISALNMSGFLRRFRKPGKITVEQAIKEISVGASLPQVDVEVLNTDDDGKISTEIKTVAELLAGTNKAIVLGKQAEASRRPRCLVVVVCVFARF